ncbi:MAG: DUF2207 domain-containing protein [Eggerthellaceae bacterium]|nr:DUF2207 domain-containing protein [Eggerthellaceae bacterium]
MNPLRFRSLHRFFLFAIAAALFSAVVLVGPELACAKSYGMPQVDIDASIAKDGSLHVVEERTFSFDGTFSCVWWQFDSLEQEMSLAVNSVQIKFPQGSIPEYETIESVPFKKSWRESGGPSSTAYSVDEARDAVYVFFSATDADMVVRLDYTVDHAAHLYEDCAELYWQYVGPDWAVSSRNVSCTIELPADGKTGIPGDTVRAWGHGPLEGTVAFQEEGTQVNLVVPQVRSGEFAEARITFPREWLSDVDEAFQRDGAILPAILEEEQREANAANLKRFVQIASSALFGILSLAAIVWSGIMFVRHGREHKPTFTDAYWRDVPHKGVHPTVIGRLMRWNRESSNDVVTTIMHLANLGAVNICKGSYELGGFRGNRIVEDYYLSLDNSVAGRLVNPIDVKLVKFLFGDVAGNRPSLWLGEIGVWGKEHATSFSNKLKDWQGAVSAQVIAQEYFEEQGSRKQTLVITAAIALFIAGLAATVFMENFFPIAFTFLAAVAMAVFGIFMPRRTQGGTDDFARAKALRKWLEDFTLLDERLPTDVKVWGDFMVYAQLFGIAKKVARDLRDTMPNVFAGDDARTVGNGTYVTWYSWYGDGHVGSVGSESFARAFDRALSNTVMTANAAVAADGIGGSLSSGCGFGGGFSGGGGGGFGGGGGGAR